MTAHDRTSHLPLNLFRCTRRRPLAGWMTSVREKLGETLVVFMPSGAEIDALVSDVRKDLSGVAANDVVHRVVSHNPDCVLGHRATGSFQCDLPRRQKG